MKPIETILGDKAAKRNAGMENTVPLSSKRGMPSSSNVAANARESILDAVALQDHLIRSIGGLGTPSLPTVRNKSFSSSAHGSASASSFSTASSAIETTLKVSDSLVGRLADRVRECDICGLRKTFGTSNETELSHGLGGGSPLNCICGRACRSTHADAAAAAAGLLVVKPTLAQTRGLIAPPPLPFLNRNGHASRK